LLLLLLLSLCIEQIHIVWRYDNNHGGLPEQYWLLSIFVSPDMRIWVPTTICIWVCTSYIINIIISAL
jgi:hypothetical protein